MASRLVMAVLWLIAIAALAGVMSLPKVVDIYIKDYYVVVSKRSIIVFF